MAKKDLEASKVLLSRKCYPQAVFFFEQAVEKGVKSLGLWAKAITEEECRKLEVVGHKAWKTFSFIIERGLKKVRDNLQIVLKENPQLEQTNLWIMIQTQISILEKETKESLGYVTSLREIETWAFSEEKLFDIINRINRFRGKLPRGLLGFGKEEIRTWKELSRLLTQNLRKISHCSQYNTDTKKIMESSKIAWKLIYSIACLFCISFIVCPHATDSRYPERDWSPLEKYKETTPLIKRLKSFMDAVKEAFDNLSVVYAKVPCLGEVFNV
jgi:HEPN domain-containing protein